MNNSTADSVDMSEASQADRQPEEDEQKAHAEPNATTSFGDSLLRHVFRTLQGEVERNTHSIPAIRLRRYVEALKSNLKAAERLVAYIEMQIGEPAIPEAHMQYLEEVIKKLGNIGY